MVGDVRVDDVDLRLGVLEHVLDGVGDRVVVLARGVRQEGRPDAAPGRRGDLRVPGRDRGRVGRQRALVIAPRGDEQGLELVDGRTRVADEDVVEALVVEVVLDPRPADVADPAVDDHELAVVEVAQVVEPPVQLALRAEASLEVGARPLVRDDPDPAVGELLVERLRAERDLAADRVDHQPDLDAGGRLRDEGVLEGRPDVTGLEAVDHQVDRRGRRLDVGQHPGEEVASVEERLDGLRGARRELDRQVGAVETGLGGERRPEGLRPVGVDGVRPGRIGPLRPVHPDPPEPDEADQRRERGEQPGHARPLLRGNRCRRTGLGASVPDRPRAPDRPDRRRASGGVSPAAPGPSSAATPR